MLTSLLRNRVDDTLYEVVWHTSLQEGLTKVVCLDLHLPSDKDFWKNKTVNISSKYFLL